MSLESAVGRINYLSLNSQSRRLARRITAIPLSSSFQLAVAGHYPRIFGSVVIAWLVGIRFILSTNISFLPP